MEINLIIPRHPYRSLGDGAKRESLHLSPDGVAALDRLATCSRSAAADLAIRVLDAIVGDDVQIVVMDLDKAVEHGDFPGNQLCELVNNCFKLARALEGHYWAVWKASG